MPTQISVGSSEFDWIVGTNVLRSMYAVYDFGDFDANNQMGNPYIQLLSVVDIEEAASVFQSSRGGTVNVNSGNGVASAGVSVETTSDKVDKLVKIIPILFGIAGANVLILITLLVLGVWMFCHFRKQKARRQKSAPLPLTTMSSRHSYEAVPTADNEGRPSSMHTRRSPSAMSRSVSKHSISGSITGGINGLTSHPNASQSSLVRPSINVSRDDEDAGSIRSSRAPESRRSSRLTAPGDLAPIKTRHSRIPSNLSAVSPTTPTTPIISRTPPQEEDEYTDAMLMAHDEKAGADITDNKDSFSKRRTFEPPPPISVIAPGYRKSMASDMSASPTVAGSETGHMIGGRERTTSTYQDRPPRQSSLNNEITPANTLSPSPTESSYQDARQSYYSNPNGSLSALPQSTNVTSDSPNTGRASVFSQAPSAGIPAVMEETHAQQQDPAAGSSRQEAQRAAFMAALNDPLPPPRRPRVAGGGGYGGSQGTGGGGLSVGAQDQQTRMSAYHALTPSQDPLDNSQYRHSYAAPIQGQPRVPAGFAGPGTGARPFQQEYAAAGSPQRSSYANNSSRRGQFAPNPSQFNPQQSPSGGS